ncbi:MAG: hypothetical protein EOP06_26110 [Proteobacteria bacterium]|nr:MAG: hypothetical protein EOP06_26110 [Pseudomonadota bacterium]
MRDNPLRRWPLEYYVELAKKLLDQGYRVSIGGGPTDAWVEPAFANLRDRLDWKVGTLPLRGTIEFLQEVELVISHDTGPVHLASFADCPIITLFGPTSSKSFGPLRFQNLVMELNPRLPCQPCYDGKDYGICSKNICLSSISPEQVFEKANSYLQRV